MVNRQLQQVLRHIRKMAGVHSGGDSSDGQLLERYAAKGDETAFSALLERHGPMVLGVCRRVLRDVHLAEDAFQATFLVLVRKAGSVRQRDRLSNWLYGVAWRVARKARARAAQRPELGARASRPLSEELGARASRPLSEMQNMTTPDPSAEAGWRELGPLLDEEVQGLPDKYREPFVLCYLEGKTNAEAARCLGCPEGTVFTRLAWARERLRTRLGRRGLALSTAGLSTLLAQNATAAALPTPLFCSTLQAAATVLAASTAAGAGGVSALTAALMEGVIKEMFLAKIKIAAAVLLSVGLAGGMTGVVMHQVLAEKEGPASSTASGGPVPSGERQSPDQPRADNPPRTDLYGDPLPPGALVRMGSERFRHRGSIERVAYSPDGKTLATIELGGDADRVEEGPDSTFHLWEAASGKEIYSLKSRRFSSLAFSPDGKNLALGGVGAIHLVEAASGKEIRLFKGHVRLDLECAVGAVAFSPDGKILASGGADYNIRVWEVSSGKELLICEGQDVVLAVAFSPDGKTLASVDEFNTIRFWQAASGKEIRICKGHALAFSPDGKTLALVDGDNTIRFCEAASGKEIRNCTTQTAVYSVAFSPDGKILASGGNNMTRGGGGICLWDVASGKEIRTCKGRQNAVRTVAFSPDGKTLASGSLDSTLRLWETASGKEITPFLGLVYTVAFSPDGKILASGSADGAVRLWHSASGKELRAFTGHQDEIHSIAFSPDGKTLASGGADRIYLWDAASGKKISGKNKDASSVAFSPDGLTLASVGDDGVVLWQAASGKKIRVFEDDDDDAFSAVAFSPDGAILALASDESIKIFGAASGKVIRILGKETDSFNSVAFSPDGKTLASGGMEDMGRGVVRLWEAATGEEIRVFKGHEGEVYSVAFSTDGRTLASADSCGNIRLWEAASGQEILAWNGDADSISSIAFSPDDKTLAATSARTILIWDVAGLSAAGPPEAAKDLAPNDLESLWADLAGDAGKAYQAIRTLTAAPKKTLPFLQEQLQPIAPVDPQRLATLIAQLDDEQYTVREKASRELELAEGAEPALRQKFAGELKSLELRRRIERVLEKLNKATILPPPEQLRVLRAVQVLEQLATPEAQALLQTLTKGAEGARLTQEAKASLERLAKRTK